MRLAIVLTIFRKELHETLRDRRTLVMMIGLPVVLYPLMLIGISKLQEARTEATEARPSVVAIWGDVPPALVRALEDGPSLTPRVDLGLDPPLADDLRAGRLVVPPLVETDEPPRQSRRPDQVRREQDNPVLDAARALVTSRRADAVVVAWSGLEAAVADDDAGHLSVYFDSVRDDSRTARERLASALDTYRASVRQQRLLSRDPPLADGFFSVFDVLVRDVSPPARQAGFILGTFLPFLLVSLSLFGGFYPAVDLTAGEKERGTMQTLLCAPIRSAEIVVGKFLTVWTVSLVAAGANVASLALTMARVLPAGQLEVAWSTYGLTALMLVPVTLTTTATFLAVAVFAKDFKDGQNFLTPVYMLLVMPSAVTMLPGIELNPWTAFVPIVNIALLIKALLVGEAAGELMFLTLVGSAAYASLAVALAVRVFQREQILLGGKESARAVLGLERRSGGVPSPMVVTSLFAVVLVLAFYGSLLLEARSVPVMLLVTQYGFFLLPALAVVWGLGYSPRATLSWRLPSVAGLTAAVLVGVSAWAVVGGVVMRLAPPPDSLVRALERVLMLGDEPMPLWVVLAVIAVTPAICEELFFRGVVMSGLRRLGQWPAIGISSLLFAVAHASIYRLLPTFVLGVLLGFLVWKTGSILTGMVVHALNNGIAATLTKSPDLAASLGVRGDTLDWTITGAALVLTAIGLALAMSLRPHVDPG